MKLGRIEPNYAREEVAEKAPGVAQKRAAGLHAPKLLHEGKDKYLGAREPFEGAAVASPRGFMCR
jgi:hypothetical protein